MVRFQSAMGQWSLEFEYSKCFTYIIRVASVLHHSSKDEQPDSITDEPKGSTAARLLTSHLRCKPLASGWGIEEINVN